MEVTEARPLPLPRAYVTKAAFTALHTRTHRYVFKYVWGRTGGPQQIVEDITAEVYARAWEARERIAADERQATSFLLTIARNLIIDRARRRKTRGAVTNVENVTLTVDDAFDPEQTAQTTEQIATLLHLMDDLPDETREMLVLRYALGWPVARIAAHLDKTSNAVYVACHRAVKTLRARWPEGGTS